MNFRQLDYILAVHKEGHFGKAAETCFVSQATLSTMVRKLEDELDITIFDRSRSPVVLTDQGKVVLKAAREIVDNMEQLQQLKSSLNGRLSGTLRLGVIPTIAPLLLPYFLKPFMSKYPDVKLKVKEATTDQLLSDLETDQLDGAVLSTPVSHTDIYEYPLYQEALKVYGVTDTEKKSVSIDEIKKSKIWLLEEGHCLSKQVISLCDLKSKSEDADGLDMKSNSFATLIGLVDEFGGYTLLPELYVNIISKQRQSKIRPIEILEPMRQVSMVVYRPFAKKQKIDAMIEVIRSQIKQIKFLK